MAHYAALCFCVFFINFKIKYMIELKCKYCGRTMDVSFLEYKSNSYCNKCFEERANSKNIIMNKQLLKRIEEIFNQKLQSKTGWGRNEIILIYKESVTEAILEFIPE